MPRDVYIGGKLYRLSAGKLRGKGTEAYVYQIDSNTAVKIYKEPDDPDYQGLALEQRAAEIKISEYQRKLPAFPKGMPPHAVIPKELAYDKDGSTIVGYTMEFVPDATMLIKYVDGDFRQSGVSNSEVLDGFCDIHSTFCGVHKAGGVLSDVSDTNILIVDNSGKKECRIIDMDASQFGTYLCRSFTGRFTDPTLCRELGDDIDLVGMYTPESDWFSYEVMLAWCILLTSPYHGVHIPKSGRPVPLKKRSINRVTVFDSDVRYPKNAISYSVLPDNLMDHFVGTFKKDKREVFPIQLIRDMRWTKCINCGMEHARNVCPGCLKPMPVAVKMVTKVHGNVTASRVFKTDGVVLHAAMQNGSLKWVYYEDRKIKRESGRSVYDTRLNPNVRYRVCGDHTLIGRGSSLLTIGGDGSLEKCAVDTYGMISVFDANSENMFWLQSGRILRDGRYEPQLIGNVLEEQTLFWAGEKLGFGLYRAGEIIVSFVFNTHQSGINDNVDLPLLRGQFVDSTCVFSDNMCWFMASLQYGGVDKNLCIAINAKGKVEATAEAQPGDGTWLGNVRGKCATGNKLFAATDSGIVRVELNNGRIEQTKEFVDTEPFVSASDYLLLGLEGLYVVSKNEISLIQIK